MPITTFCTESTSFSSCAKMYAKESDCIFSESSFGSPVQHSKSCSIMSPPLSANSVHFQAPNCNLKSYQHSYVDFTMPNLPCAEASHYNYIAETPNSVYGDCVDEQKFGKSCSSNGTTKEDIFRFEPEDIARLTDAQCNLEHCIANVETPQTPYTPAAYTGDYNIDDYHQLTTAVTKCSPAAATISQTTTDFLNLDIEYFNYDEINCQSKNQSPCSSPPLDPWMTLSLNDGNTQQQQQQTQKSFSPKRCNNFDYESQPQQQQSCNATKLPSMMTTFGTPKYEPISGIVYNNYVDQEPQNMLCNTNIKFEQQMEQHNENSNNLLSATEMIKPNREHKTIWTIDELDELNEDDELMNSLAYNTVSKLEPKAEYNENQNIFDKDIEVHQLVDYLASIDDHKRENDAAAHAANVEFDNYCNKVFIDFGSSNNVVENEAVVVIDEHKSVVQCVVDNNDSNYDDCNDDDDDGEDNDSVFITTTAQNPATDTKFTTNSNHTQRTNFQRCHVSGKQQTNNSTTAASIVAKAASFSNIASLSVADLTICNNNGINSDGDGGKPQQQESLVCRWTDCNKVFTRQVEFVTHIEKRHVDVRKGEDFSCFWLNCPRRYKPFNARYKLLIHMRVHSGEKPNKCPFPSCNKAFSRLENLKIHQRSHTGERPYGCQYKGCLKAFSNSSDRAKHQRTHYDTKPYYCQLPGCTKRYTDPSSLRKHVKNHTFRNTNGYTGRRKSASSISRKTRGSEAVDLLTTNSKTRRHSETSVPICTISDQAINEKQFSAKIINNNDSNNKLQQQQRQQKQQQQGRSYSCSEMSQLGSQAMRTEIEIYTQNIIMPTKANVTTNSICDMPIEMLPLANNSKTEECSNKAKNGNSNNSSNSHNKNNNSMNFNELSNCIVTIAHNQNENSIDENDYEYASHRRSNGNGNGNSNISTNTNTIIDNTTNTNKDIAGKTLLSMMTTVDALLTTEMNAQETDVCCNGLNFSSSNNTNNTHCNGNDNGIECINQLNGLEHLLTLEATATATTTKAATTNTTLNHNEWNSFAHMTTVADHCTTTKRTKSVASCASDNSEEFVSFEYVKKLLTENFMDVDQSPFHAPTIHATEEVGKNCHQNITTVAAGADRCDVVSVPTPTISANDVAAANLLLAPSKAANDSINNINIQSNSSNISNTSSIKNTNRNASANTIVITNNPCTNININTNTNAIANDNDICVVAAQDFANNFEMDYLNSFM